MDILGTLILVTHNNHVIVHQCLSERFPTFTSCVWHSISMPRHIMFVMPESPLKILRLQWSKHNSYRVLLTRTMNLVGYFVTPLFCNVLWKRMFVLTNSISWIKSDWKRKKITLLYVFLTFIVAVFRNYHTRRFDDSCWSQTKQLNTA